MVGAEEAYKQQQLQQQKKARRIPARDWHSRISFSAKLPGDVYEMFEDSICAVMYSSDPISDLRDSIMEMIREVGVSNWDEMEELVYCYIALNSSDVHRFIYDAFLSLASRVSHLGF